MALVRIDSTTVPFEGGRAFGDTGAYEVVRGTAEFAFDPELAVNRVIADINLAPTDADGRVRCEAEFIVLRPVDASRGNGRLLYDVPNRGNLLALRRFDVDPAPPSTDLLAVGDGWLLSQGYTLAWCGWQHDVPPELDRLHIRVSYLGGQREEVSGRVTVRWHPIAPASQVTLSDGGHVPYPAAALDEIEAVLTVREHPTADPVRVPRREWSFARLDADGRAIPDRGVVLYPAGFAPGRFYELTYTAMGAVPTGLGLAATRDFVSFLRHGADPVDSAAELEDPLAGRVRYALGYGASQSGAFLRTLLHLGLHEDEAGRLVFDGVLADIAGAFAGELNWRFGQPSYYGPYSPSWDFPFAEVEQAEPHSGRRAGRMRAGTQQPRVMFTNTSAEYWYLHAALTHLVLADETDAPLPDHVRLYLHNGTHHGGATFPLTQRTAVSGDTPAAQHPLNAVEYRALMRAYLVSLDRWATEGIEPPPSQYPRIADGTLVTAEAVREAFDQIGVAGPPAHLFRLGPLDFGEGAEWGEMTKQPPEAGPPWTLYVPAVDEDGNELGGVRLPDIAVPLATHTGWNRRHEAIGAPDHVGPTLSGATIPFAPTDEARSDGDRRRSIAARYPSREAYLEAVRKHAESLLAGRHLLADDVETVTRNAAARWDAWATAR